MRIMPILFACAAMTLCQAAVSPAFAAETDPLFVNATTDQPHRAEMALFFSKNQLDRKHPVTIFLNDRGVLIASKANQGKFKVQQKQLEKLMAAGATVIACAMCMKYYRVKDADLLPGIKISNPQLIEGTLFKANTKTMTW